MSKGLDELLEVIVSAGDLHDAGDGFQARGEVEDFVADAMGMALTLGAMQCHAHPEAQRILAELVHEVAKLKARAAREPA